jgi:hypothetical protein
MIGRRRVRVSSPASTLHAHRGTVLERDPPSPPGTEPPSSAPPEPQPIKELPPASRRRRARLIGLVAGLVAVGGALGAMAALDLVPFGGARSPAATPCPTVTTTTRVERHERIKLPDTLGGCPRNDPPSTPPPFEFRGLEVYGARYGGTDAKHPALTLTFQGLPSHLFKVDMVATFINTIPDEWGFRASDFHTFKHGGVEYRCADGRTMSGGRQALCVFFDRRFSALIWLFGLEASVADAERLSAIADEARVALDTI